MKKVILLLPLLMHYCIAQAQIDLTTYPFSYTTGIALEDMSSGTTQFIGPNVDDGGSSTLVDIGFNFRFAGSRFTQFHPSANGYLRLGQTINGAGTATDYTNGIYQQTPCIAPYWDDLFIGNNGEVHYKTTGTAPNRKCIIEWKNMHVPYNSNNLPGTATFQVWLSETSGAIQFVYGNGLVANTANGGSTIGISSQSATNVSVLAATNTAQTSQFNANTVAILAGTSYALTPNLATAPTALTFTSTSAVATTLNWVDNATNETGYEIFRSDDGGLTYQFLVELPANTTTIENTMLLPNINYYYMVSASTSGGRSTVINNVTTMATTAKYSNGTGGGNWDVAATWQGGTIPTQSDSVIILGGDAVHVLGGNTAYHLTVKGSAVLDYNPIQSSYLTVGGSVLIENGGVFSTATSGGISSHVCAIGSNLTNLGTLDFAIGSQGTELIFNGPYNSLYSGTGSTNDLFKLSPSKTSRDKLIDINVSNFSVSGLSTNATGGLLHAEMEVGTIKFSGNNTFGGTLWSYPNYTIPTDVGVWINNPNFTVQALAGTCTNNGLLQLTAGQFNIGTLNNNSLNIGLNSKLIIDGGTMNIAGRLDGWSGSNGALFAQSGGTLNVATIGLNVANRGAIDFAANMIHHHTGGQIIIVQPNLAASQPVAYRSIANTRIFTGGTVVFGSNATMGTTAVFRALGNLPNTIIANNTGGAAKQLYEGLAANGNGAYNLSILGSLEVQPSALFNLDGYQCLVAGNILNNGTIAGGGVNNTFVMAGSSTGVSYAGSGVCGTSTAPMHRFIINKTTPFELSNGLTNNIVIADLGLYNGAVINANKLTLGAGGASATSVTCYDGTVPSTLDQYPIFNLGTGGQNLFYYDEVNPRTTGFEVNPSRIINNLTVANSYSDLTLAGGNLTVANATNLSFKNINLSGNTFTVGTSTANPGSFATNNELVHTYNGKFARWVPAALGGSYFPVGNGIKRQGAFINYTTAPTSGGLLTGEWKAEAPGTNGLPLVDGMNLLNQTNSNGYWSINASNGLAGGTYYFAGTAKGLAGITDYSQLAVVKRADAASPWMVQGTHYAPQGTNDSFIVFRLDLTSFSDFAIAGNNTALPQTLLAFHGQKLKDYNLLQWETADEKSISSFELQRSDNSKEFETIAEVTAKKNISNRYSYEDYDAWKENIRFYRLKMLDADGQFSYSKVVQLSQTQKGNLSLYPNPTQNTLHLEGLTVGATIKLFDVAGKSLLERTVHSSTETIDMQSYSKGIYLLQYVDAGEVEEVKVVRE